MHCVACVIPVVKREDKVIFWCFFLNYCLVVFMISMFFFLFIDLRTDYSKLDEKSTFLKQLHSSGIIITFIFHLFQHVSEVSITGKSVDREKTQLNVFE
jgi:hypothetical protein